MRLRTCSAAVVAIVLTTSAWADDAALGAANLMKCPGGDFVVQLCESDLTENAHTASIAPDVASDEVDPVAAIVDKIAQNTVLISISLPWIDDESSAVASGIGSDPAEVTGSIVPVEFALDGLEDR